MRTQCLYVLASCAIFACTNGTEPTDIAGTYTATVFKVTPTGQAQIDVLAAGGSLTITIGSANATSGSLNIPASINGGTPFTASMTGTASLSGTTVHFQQTADSFVRDLAWTASSNSLTVTSQVVAGASYTITLSK